MLSQIALLPLSCEARNTPRRIRDACTFGLAVLWLHAMQGGLLRRCAFAKLGGTSRFCEVKSKTRVAFP